MIDKSYELKNQELPEQTAAPSVYLQGLNMTTTRTRMLLWITYWPHRQTCFMAVVPLLFVFLNPPKESGNIYIYIYIHCNKPEYK